MSFIVLCIVYIGLYLIFKGITINIFSGDIKLTEYEEYKLKKQAADQQFIKDIGKAFDELHKEKRSKRKGKTPTSLDDLL